MKVFLSFRKLNNIFQNACLNNDCTKFTIMMRNDNSDSKIISRQTFMKRKYSCVLVVVQMDSIIASFYLAFTSLHNIIVATTHKQTGEFITPTQQICDVTQELSSNDFLMLSFIVAVAIYLPLNISYIRLFLLKSSPIPSIFRRKIRSGC